jgi:hypothetical protein
MVGGWAAAEFPARGGGRIDGEWEECGAMGIEAEHRWGMRRKA